MALSDEEQRLLEQMEAALAAEDPKLVNALRGTSVRRVHRRRAALAGVGFFAGLGLLIAGISITPFLSVLGFVIMVAAAVTATQRPSPGRMALVPAKARVEREWEKSLGADMDGSDVMPEDPRSRSFTPTE